MKTQFFSLLFGFLFVSATTSAQSFGVSSSVDMLEIDVSIRPDFSRQSFSARASYRLKSQADTLSKMFFAINRLKIDSVTSSTGPVAFSFNTDSLLVTPVAPFSGLFSFNIFYHADSLRNDLFVIENDSTWLARRNGVSSAHWLPTAFGPSVYALLKTGIHLPESLNLVASGVKTIDSLVTPAWRFIRHETNEPVRIADATWMFGRFADVERTFGDKTFRVFLHQKQRFPDSLAAAASAFSSALEKIETWTGQKFETSAFNLAIVPDLWWETRPTGTGFMLVVPDIRPWSQSVRMGAVEHLFGGSLFAADTIGAKWMASAQQLAYEEIFKENYSDIAQAQWLDRRQTAFSGFELSKAVVLRWSRERGVVGEQELLELAFEADGLSHFGLQSTLQPKKSRFNLKVSWIETGKTPFLEWDLDSLASPVNATLVTKNRRSTYRTQVLIQPDSILEMDMKSGIQNFWIEDIPSGVTVQLVKPDNFWINQVRTSKEVEVRKAGIRALQGVRNNPDLQLFLFDLLKTETNKTLRAECLATLAVYLNGATGSAELFLKELAKPDTAFKKRAAAALRFYGENPDHTSVLLQELRKTPYSDVRLEIVRSLASTMDSLSWLRFVERSLIQSAYPEIFGEMIELTGKKFTDESINAWLVKWFQMPAPVYLKAILLNKLEVNDVRTGSILDNISQKDDIRFCHIKELLMKRNSAQIISE